MMTLTFSRNGEKTPSVEWNDFHLEYICMDEKHLNVLYAYDICLPFSSRQQTVTFCVVKVKCNFFFKYCIFLKSSKLIQTYYLLRGEI